MNKGRFFTFLALFIISALVWYFWPTSSLVSDNTTASNSSQPVVKKENLKSKSLYRGKKVDPLVKNKTGTVPSHNELLKMIASDSKSLKTYRMGQARNKAIKFYGRVIDQHGEPVSNAKVIFSVGRWEYLNADGYVYYGKTDGNGMFEFEGEKGYSLNIRSVQRDGYEIDVQGAGFRAHPRTVGDTTTNLWKNYTKDKPYVIHAWKITEFEPLYYGEYKQKIRNSGVVEPIKIPNLNGGLTVKFDLDPNGKPYKPENWTISIKANAGGLIESNNEVFMYLAPETGYKSVWSKAYTKGEKGFTDEDRKKFYFRSGNTYGRMEINYVAYYKKGVAGILRIKYWINPTGSRNLQYDPSIRIQ